MSDDSVPMHSKLAALLGMVEQQLPKLPGGAALQSGFKVAEETVLKGLRERLDDVATEVRGGESQATEAQQLLADLLNKAADQSFEDSQQSLYSCLLKQMVPDEARIVAALSDGSEQALVHVAAGPPVGPVLKRALENVSNVGRSASVMQLDLVPQYIGHLIQLGLLETGPESAELEIKYEVLLGDQRVRETAKQVEKDYKFPARYLKRTIRLSTLGKQLWDDCLTPQAYL